MEEIIEKTFKCLWRVFWIKKTETKYPKNIAFEFGCVRL